MIHSALAVDQNSSPFQPTKPAQPVIGCSWLGCTFDSSYPVNVVWGMA